MNLYCISGKVSTFLFPLDMFHVVKEGLLTSREFPFYFTSGFFTALSWALVSTPDV